MDFIEEMMEEGQIVRVFGYGSLLWKPDFRYEQAFIGRIEGYKRRFWQGNVTHRGTDENIGRVATLIPSNKSKVWGVMFEVRDQEAKSKALNGLTNREVFLGGYDVIATTFYPRDGECKPCLVIVFMATSQNSYFLGKANTDTMAMQIVNAVGPCGTNIEYVTKMADYIKEHIPEDKDTHLFKLDKRVREMSDQKHCLNKSIGQKEFFEERQETDG
ncbi:putative glutathione-specific gamma-glutamylcyclotransferase 2 [Mercenaria mercenaria]|uniref:putative glutathione-specific gamma-glutamylcyclotransferase 2 n=1 Tax=Mercenaria mercenaria TaxID=6596 RepID=UPI00234F426B|nr:putative glutathione-specific gamma-glutamylcyclotransferase 2 [Mercenaria mercenaria]